MAMFDTLIDDLAGRYGLGANARAFVGEVLAMVVNSPDGVGGFLQRLRSGGLTSEVGSWLGRPDAAPLPAQQVEQALGATALGRVANRLGLAQDVVATAMGYALPKIVGLLTPDGAIPGGVPVEVTRFLSRTPVATVTPRRVDAPPSPTPEQAGVTRWLWPALAALVVVGFLSYFWSTLNRIPPAPPVAKAPEPSTVAQAPTPPPAPSPTPPLQPATQAPAPASTETQPTTPPPPAPRLSRTQPLRRLQPKHRRRRLRRLLQRLSRQRRPLRRLPPKRRRRRLRRLLQRRHLHLLRPKHRRRRQHPRRTRKRQPHRRRLRPRRQRTPPRLRLRRPNSRPQPRRRLRARLPPRVRPLNRPPPRRPGSR